VDIRGSIRFYPVSYIDATASNLNGTRESTKLTSEHLLLQEIREQPPAILETLEAEKAKIPQAVRFLGRRGIHFVGMGSSYCSGLYAKYLLQELAQRRSEAHLASEFIHYPPSLTLNDVFVAISQSGESIETVKAVELLRRKHSHIRILAITNDPESKLAKLSDLTLLTHAGIEKVSATKTFTSTLALLYVLVATIAQRSGKISERKRSQLWNHLTQSAKILEENFGTWEDTANSLADCFASCRSLMIVGRGLNVVAALQGALIFKEVAKAPTEGMSGGEFTHGPMEALSSEIGVVVLGGGRTGELQLKLAQRAKALGAGVLMLTPQRTEGVNSIEFVERDETLMAFPCNVILNLLTYFTAIKKGLDTDKFTVISKVTRVE
jgi:glucosamine--fructose-6-phosphate aminotransferase (isomerizing)